MSNKQRYSGAWSAQIHAYLWGFRDKQTCEILLTYHLSEHWPQSGDFDEHEALISSLLAPILLEDEVETTPRQTIASVDDVSLIVPNDVDQELLDGLLMELPTQAAAYAHAVQSLSDGGSTQELDVAQRVAHTLKGAGNTVGIRGIATLMHPLEDILESLAKKNRMPTPALCRTLVRAADCLEAMCESLLGIGPAPQ